MTNFDNNQFLIEPIFLAQYNLTADEAIRYNS